MHRRPLLLASLLPALAATEASASPGFDAAMLQEVNGYRVYSRRPPVRLDARLTQAAQAHSVDMLRSGRMSHTGSDGSDTGIRIGRAGYRWRSYRENVGAGYATVRDAMAGWIYSPSHRDNLLAEDVTQIGVGYAGAPGLMAGNIPRLFWTLVLAAPR